VETLQTNRTLRYAFYAVIFVASENVEVQAWLSEVSFLFKISLLCFNVSYLEVAGNLCQHAVLHHSGNSAYLNIMKGSHILYSNKRLFEFNGIYVDSYGMVVTDYEYRQTDMQNFKLN
jgi:hypothetical protein